MLLVIAGVLGILWLLGVIVNIGGGLIHLILLVALMILIYDLFTSRRRV